MSQVLKAIIDRIQITGTIYNYGCHITICNSFYLL